MELPDDFKETIKQFRLMLADIQNQYIQAIVPVIDLTAAYQNQMKAIALMLSEYTDEFNKQIRLQIAPMIEQIFEKNRLSIGLTLPQPVINKIVDMPHEVERIIPDQKEISQLYYDENISNKAKENKFNWRDALTVIGLLISILAIMENHFSKNDRDDNNVHQQIKDDAHNTINYFWNSYNFYFPEDLPHISPSQDENPDLDH